MKKPIVKLLTLFFMLLLVLGGRAQASQAQTNLLQNASFEFPYQNNGEASSWGRWHRNSSEDQFKDCTNGYHKRPTWSAETNGALVQSGSVSQHIGNQWDTWSAGVFQTVNVNPGSTYRFSVWSYAFGSNNDFPGPVEAGLNANIQVGIDPNGSGLWNDSDVVWSGTINRRAAGSKPAYKSPPPATRFLSLRAPTGVSKALTSAASIWMSGLIQLS